MTGLSAGLLLLACLLVLWSYVLYPALARRLAGRAPAPPQGAPWSPSVEVLVCAADEEDVIAARVRDLLTQNAGDSYRVTIGCDGCADATAERAREAGDSRVRVLEFRTRRGKAAVLNDLIAQTRAEVLVFTDANTRFEPGAVRELVASLADTSVGAACGRLVLETGHTATPEAVFWDRETALKEAEGRLGVCLGANGAIYAARREAVLPLPEDTTSMDDFLIPVRIARQGRRVVFAARAVAREDAGRDVAAELARRFRIGVGAGQVLRRERWLFDFRRHGLLSLAFVSRKVARWLAPVFALAAAGAALFDASLRPFAAAALGALLLALLLARGRPRLRGLAARLYYFSVINLALAAGVLAGLAGYSRPAWRRTAR